VRFHPQLSQRKRDAIRTFGMGSENKIVLRFDPLDVFWPTSVPYFISTDDRFRFLSLHYYGKPGILVVHGQPPFSWNWGGLDDTKLVLTLRESLASMFGLSKTPEPLETHVTRWDRDPFSLGSYSYFSVGSSIETVQDLGSCEGLPSEKRVHFAGEGCSNEGHQCVHGAYGTGLDAAKCIIERYKGDGRDAGPPKEGYGATWTPAQSVECSACGQWKDISVSEEEFERIGMMETWACEACEAAA